MENLHLLRLSDERDRASIKKSSIEQDDLSRNFAYYVKKSVETND